MRTRTLAGPVTIAFLIVCAPAAGAGELPAVQETEAFLSNPEDAKLEAARLRAKIVALEAELKTSEAAPA